MSGYSIPITATETKLHKMMPQVHTLNCTYIRV